MFKNKTGLKIFLIIIKFFQIDRTPFTSSRIPFTSAYVKGACACI